MSQLPPAGGRLLQSLQSRMSPSTQNLFGGTAVVNTNTPQVADVVPNYTADQASSLADSGEESEKLQLFEEVLNEVEQGLPDPLQANVSVSDATFVEPPANFAEPVVETEPVPAPELYDTPLQTIASALDPEAIYRPSETSGLFAQAIPTAVDQVQEQLQQQVPQVGGRQKEAIEGGSTVAAPEMPADVQYVEEEKSHELPPEVESYIQKVEDIDKTQPQEIVVAEDVAPPAPSVAAPKRVVKVLPLTKEQEEIGIRKSPSFSIRWLVEYGHKLAKALVGQVVYHEN